MITPAVQLALGEERRDAALDGLERHAWVQEARAVAAALCEVQEFVTSDDIRDYMGDPPHKNMMGPVLRPPYFASVGLAPSRRPSSHGRRMWRWVLA